MQLRKHSIEYPLVVWLCLAIPRQQQRLSFIYGGVWINEEITTRAVPQDSIEVQIESVNQFNFVARPVDSKSNVRKVNVV